MARCLVGLGASDAAVITPGDASSPPWLEGYWLIILIIIIVAALLSLLRLRTSRSAGDVTGKELDSPKP